MSTASAPAGRAVPTGRTAPAAPAPETAPQFPAARAEALEAAIRLLRERPVHELSLELVDRAAALPAGTARTWWSDTRMLMVDVVQVWSAGRAAESGGRDGAVASLRGLLVQTSIDPAWGRVLLGAGTIAGRSDHPAAGLIQQQWVAFHASIQRALSRDIALGLEPATMDPARGAEQLLALYLGLLFQWMMRPAMDLVEAYDRATARLRHGWTEEYRPVTWSL